MYYLVIASTQKVVARQDNPFTSDQISDMVTKTGKVLEIQCSNDIKEPEEITDHD